MTIDPIVHKRILIRILKDIYSDSAIGPIMGFKGGTAANLFYDLDRFSVDLDFDLLDISKANDVFEQVNDLLKNYGTLKRVDKKRNGFVYILDYSEKMPGSQNVKVEINLRNFGSKFVILSYLGIPMKVMERGDMAANKMVAFYERIGKANRDIYDTWFFLVNNWPVNEKLIEQRMDMSYKEFLEKCCGLLENLSNHAILSGMGEVLSEKQKIWVKNKLKNELLFQIRLLLTS
ncbi:MAG: hypothetical protein ACD_72C00543G0002 [uncultured bacterium]|nr:MAG: hypothetical protein ACD_72C00543G0002 [uncultured bacterium]HCS38785.1 hypothetical protein [Anaerolineaceae bacterium]